MPKVHKRENVGIAFQVSEWRQKRRRSNEKPDTKFTGDEMVRRLVVQDKEQAQADPERQGL